MLEIIRQRGDGPVPLLNRHVRDYDELYLRAQTCLHPHPVELKLRNRA